MHFQFPPAAETKLVRCTRGAILDIIVDLRPESPTYLEHVAVELDEDNGRALYVPERFAHGYQTLVDDTETSYQVGEFYTPRPRAASRYDDPRLGLEWPLPVAAISEKDAQWAPLDEVEPELRRRMARRGGARDHRRHRAAGARGARDARSASACRRRLHGPGPDEPDRQQRPRDARGRRSRTGSPSGRSTSFRYAGLEPRARRLAGAARGRGRAPAARP